MADYVGIYVSDFAEPFALTRLRVYSFNGDLEAETTRTGDLEYLPQTFLGYVGDPIPKQIYCGTPFSQRYAQCFIDDEFGIIIPIPFHGGSSLFIEFWKELVNEITFRSVELVGERVSPGRSRILRKPLGIPQ